MSPIPAAPEVEYKRRIGVANFHLDELLKIEAHLRDRAEKVSVTIGDEHLEGGVQDLPQVRLRVLRERLRLRVDSHQFDMWLGRDRGYIRTLDGALGQPGRQLVDEVAGILDVRRYDPGAVARLVGLPILLAALGVAMVAVGLLRTDSPGALRALYVIGGVAWAGGACIALGLRRHYGAAWIHARTAAEADRERRRVTRDIAFLVAGGVVGVAGQALYDAARAGS